jgi:TetR/AcrR family transcriptional repressor of bet genes
MRHARNSSENARRRALIDAAYATFMENGIKGMTMARIGERAGMSHGIVNYYFQSKDDLLVAVMRKATFLIMSEMLRRLKLAQSPRERVSAVVNANFSDDLFTRESAKAWVSYYAIIADNADFERLQNAIDRRIATNLCHALKQLTEPKRAAAIAQSVALLIDGLWLRHARSTDRRNADRAIRHIEEFVDAALA